MESLEMVDCRGSLPLSIKILKCISSYDEPISLS